VCGARRKRAGEHEKRRERCRRASATEISSLAGVEGNSKEVWEELTRGRPLKLRKKVQGEKKKVF